MPKRLRPYVYRVAYWSRGIKVMTDEVSLKDVNNLVAELFRYGHDDIELRKVRKGVSND